MKAFVFDTETTGLIQTRLLPIAKQPHLIEFYGIEVDLDTGETGFEIDKLIKPPVPITAEITKITGIDDEMVKDAKSFGDYANLIYDSLSGATCVIAHNASFDKEMMDIEFERIELQVPWPKIICTVEQTVHILGYRLSLQALHEYLFGTKFKGAHRAKVDVQNHVRCCVELRKRGVI